MPTFVAPNGVTVQLFSTSGELYDIFSDADESGEILDAQVVVKRLGGLTDLSFNIPRSRDIPITRNNKVKFIVDSVAWYSGYITDVPQVDQNEPIINVTGKGFVSRLAEKNINETYTSQTFDFIIKDLLSSNLGADIDVIYNVAKISSPTITGITLEFDDISLLNAVLQLVSLANKDYLTTSYVFTIDNDQEFVFGAESSSIILHLFEGYHYQTPEVSEDTSLIINRVSSYRATSADPNAVEFVSVIDDTESQGKYGLFEKKITYSSFVDTTTIANIANAIIERSALPQKVINAMDIELRELLGIGNGPLDPGKYLLENRRSQYWNVAAPCDTLVGWDLAGVTVTTVIVDTTRVLTGRRSLKCVTGNGSLDEFIEFTLSQKIPFPIAARVFVYFVTTATPIIVTFFDIDSNSESIQFNSIDDVLEVNQPPIANLEVTDSGGPTTDDMGVDFTTTATVDQWTRFQRAISSLADITRVRVTFKTDSVATLYIDRLDNQADIYKDAELFLEEARYNLSSVGLFANLFFGEAEPSLVDEIKSKVEDGNIALQVFSKQ